MKLNGFKHALAVCVAFFVLQPLLAQDFDAQSRQYAASRILRIHGLSLNPKEYSLFELLDIDLY